MCFAADAELDNARKQPCSGVPAAASLLCLPACQPSICGTETENSAMDKMERSLLWLSPPPTRRQQPSATHRQVNADGSRPIKVST